MSERSEQEQSLHDSSSMGVTKTVATGALASAALVLSTQTAASAAIPLAMKTFGTVVPGLGTIHASLATYGLAAYLQWIAAVSSSPACVVMLGIAGGCICVGAKVGSHKADEAKIKSRL